MLLQYAYKQEEITFLKLSNARKTGLLPNDGVLFLRKEERIVLYAASALMGMGEELVLIP